MRSSYVRDKASRALKQGKLLPLRIEDVELPLGFGQLHTLDLLRWNGDAGGGKFQTLLFEVRQRRQQAPGGQAPPQALRRWPRSPTVMAGGALALALIGAASWVVYDRQQAAKQRIADTGRAQADRHFRAGLDQQYARVPQLETALNEYLSALELRPAHARARYYLGHVYAQTGKPADALDSFKRALAATDAPLDRSQSTDAEKQLRTIGSVDVSFAGANGVKRPPIEARDDGHTEVWPRSATKSGGFLTPFPSGCPQEGPSRVLQSLTGGLPQFRFAPTG